MPTFSEDKPTIEHPLFLPGPNTVAVEKSRCEDRFLHPEVVGDCWLISSVSYAAAGVKGQRCSSNSHCCREDQKHNVGLSPLFLFTFVLLLSVVMWCHQSRFQTPAVLVLGGRRRTLSCKHHMVAAPYIIWHMSRDNMQSVCQLSLLVSASTYCSKNTAYCCRRCVKISI